MPNVREKLWIWGHEAGSLNDRYNLPGCSRMTPVEAAFYMGIPNVIMVRCHNKPASPFNQYAMSFTPLQKFIWSIVGDAGTHDNDGRSDVDEVVALASKFPNLTGAMMDDFFCNPSGLGRCSINQLQEIRGKLQGAVHPLELWVVLYNHQLDQPLQEYLSFCDVISFWTWKAKDLDRLEENLAAVEKLAGDQKLVLGCYMWDFGGSAPMPVPAMEQQCRLGLEWLKAGRIQGMIFLASCICDLGLEAVEWTRRWIDKVGREEL